jgi:hypothetical protein
MPIIFAPRFSCRVVSGRSEQVGRLLLATCGRHTLKACFGRKFRTDKSLPGIGIDSVSVQSLHPRMGTCQSYVCGHKRQIFGIIGELIFHSPLSF